MLESDKATCKIKALGSMKLKKKNDNVNSTLINCHSSNKEMETGFSLSCEVESLLGCKSRQLFGSQVLNAI